MNIKQGALQPLPKLQPWTMPLGEAIRLAGKWNAEAEIERSGEHWMIEPLATGYAHLVYQARNEQPYRL